MVWTSQYSILAENPKAARAPPFLALPDLKTRLLNYHKPRWVLILTLKIIDIFRVWSRQEERKATVITPNNARRVEAGNPISFQFDWKFLREDDHAQCKVLILGKPLMQSRQSIKLQVKGLVEVARDPTASRPSPLSKAAAFL